VFCFGPVLLSFLGSILPDKALFSNPPDWFGHGFSFDNYRFTFTGAIPREYRQPGANVAVLDSTVQQVPGSMVNSTIVALWVMAVNIVAGSPAAYAFARMRFPFKMATFVGILITRLVPVVALATPFYLMIQALGLLGTKLAIVLVHSVQTLPFTMLILTLFFRRIPMEIEDAAAVDGCTRFQSFFRITVPLSIPSVAATGLFAFMLSYAEFLFALILSGKAEARSLAVVMAALSRNIWMSWGLMNTGVFLAMIPSAILVVVVWKFVIEPVLEVPVRR
jgi:multiple sugar transport system permease protein